MNYMFDAKIKKVQYYLDWHSCYKCLTGTCSLDLENPIDIENLIPGISGTFEHCRKLATYMENIEDTPITKKSWGAGQLSILITEHENGVYKPTDGQHRICIAQKLGLILMVSDGKD